MPRSHSLRCSFMGSAGFRKMKALEITAKLQTATMELVPNGPTTYTRYVCKVRINYVLSDNLRCWPGTCSSNMNMFFIITLRDYFVHLPKTCFGIQRIILKLGVGFFSGLCRSHRCGILSPNLSKILHHLTLLKVDSKSIFSWVLTPDDLFLFEFSQF